MPCKTASGQTFKIHALGAYIGSVVNALTAFAEDPGLVPNTHTMTHNYTSPLPWDPTPSYDF